MDDLVQTFAEIQNPIYDPSKYIFVNIMKPLGIRLEEVVPHGSRGVYVCQVNEQGKAKKENLICEGFFLIEANGTDFKNAEYETVMEALHSCSDDEPLCLVFIKIEDVHQDNEIVAENSVETQPLLQIEAHPQQEQHQVQEKTQVPVGDLVNDTITVVLTDPIQCGYLLAFCTKEHSTENLNFIIEVNRYRDIIGNSDSVSWTRTWIEIDADADAIARNIKWPSVKLREDAVRAHAQKIWDDYLSQESLFEVCLSAKIFDRTLQRLKRVDLYGPHVFEEALLEPTKTLKTDTLRRFLASKMFREMTSNLDSLASLPLSYSLSVEAPTGTMVVTPDVAENRKKFSLDDLLSNNFLYKQFLSHLNTTQSAENLLCVRMIAIFLEHMSAKDIKRAKAQAWNIYRYFVASGSAFEVSLYSLHKKEVMLALAMPNVNMFDELKKSAMMMLMVNFNTYRGTEEYRRLGERWALNLGVPKRPPPSLLERATSMRVPTKF